MAYPNVTFKASMIGILHGIPRSSIEFHGTFRSPLEMISGFNSMEFLGRHFSKYTRVPWTSIEYSMKFHGILHRILQSENQTLPTMEIIGTTSEFYQLPRNIPWTYIELVAKSNITEFRGIPWNLAIALWNSIYKTPIIMIIEVSTYRMRQ